VTDVDSATTAAWLARDEAALAGVLSRIHDIVAERGEGSWLVDVDGRRYLDFASGIAATNVGHCHPKVVEAVVDQARSLLHTSVVAHHLRSIEAAERIGGLTPFFESPKVFLCNSGAEAVDGGLKLARRVTGRPGVIAFRRAFHGRTLAATTITTAKGKYRVGYEPLLPSVHIAPYCTTLGFDSDEEAVASALAGLDDILTLQAPGPNVGAMIVEPVLGEGGYVPPPKAWLEGLRARCDEHGILLIFDEVQSGMGRTGRPFAAETYGVTPDVILFAKGVASGLPLGGIVAPKAVMDKWPPGAHGSTFGGNPVACAACVATLQVMDEEGVYDRVRSLGERALARLREATDGNPAVLQVRGIGFMLGVELVDAAAADAVQRRCLEDDLIVLTCGPDENVLRLIPPLTIAEDDLDHGLDILAKAFATLV
jgi:4-aminobutyrate aminotransferase